MCACGFLLVNNFDNNFTDPYWTRVWFLIELALGTRLDAYSTKVVVAMHI